MNARLAKTRHIINRCRFSQPSVSTLADIWFIPCERVLQVAARVKEKMGSKVDQPQDKCVSWFLNQMQLARWKFQERNINISSLTDMKVWKAATYSFYSKVCKYLAVKVHV